MRFLVDLSHIFESSGKERLSLILKILRELAGCVVKGSLMVGVPHTREGVGREKIEFLDKLGELVGFENLIGIPVEDFFQGEAVLLNRGIDLVLSLFSGVRGKDWIRGKVLWNIPVIKFWEAYERDYELLKYRSFYERENFFYLCPSNFSASLLRRELKDKELRIKVLPPLLNLAIEDELGQGNESLSFSEISEEFFILGLPWEVSLDEVLRTCFFLNKGLQEFLKEKRKLKLIFLLPSDFEGEEGILEILRAYEGRVIIYKGLSLQERIELYRRAKGLIYLSFGEPYPYPLVEALSFGVRVVAKNKGAVPEVLPIKEVLFEEESEDFLRKVRGLYEKEGLFERAWSELREKTISLDLKNWVKAIVNYIEEIRDKFNRTKEQSFLNCFVKRKPKLAYVSPLPPLKTGVANYGEELLPFLSKYYDIFLVSDQEELTPSLSKKFEILSVEAFKRKAKYFDRILYHVGNSFYHKEILELLETIPGVVVLHDFYLSGLYHWMDFFGFKRGVFFKEFIKAHGLSPLLNFGDNLDALVEAFPLNKQVVNLSLGVIVHSYFARNYFKNFYSQVNLKKIKVIPHLREPKEVLTKGEELICHLGFINKLKGVKEIIQAFVEADIPESWKLIFAGTFAEDVAYEKEVRNLIRKIGKKRKIEITGYLREKDYLSYIKKGSLFIQLRTSTRGETSGAVLDLMSYGKPVIVNKIGWFEEIPDEVVYKIPRDFEVEDIKKAIEEMVLNIEKREEIGKRAFEYIKGYHHPERVAFEYFSALEEFYETNEEKILIEEMEFRKDKTEKEFVRIMKNTFKPILRHRGLYVDITSINRKDAGTGIQRAVKLQLKYLLLNPPEGFKVYPVSLKKREENGVKEWYYEYSWGVAEKLIEHEVGRLACRVEPQGEVSFYEGDILYMPDLSDWYYVMICDAEKDGFYSNLRIKGVKMVAYIHDMLPVKWPEYFVEKMSKNHAKWSITLGKLCNKIICPTKAVLEDVENFLIDQKSLKTTLKLDYLHYPVDIIDKVPHELEETLGEEELKSLINDLTKTQYFLMVSTLEPRKGHEDILKAFEILWGRGFDYALVFVGKEGWKVETLVRKIREHPEWNKRLFWLGYVSDKVLDKLYENALAIVGASKDEGFGLFIVEAAFKEKPIIARDIKVFREIGGEEVFYFPNTDNAEKIAEAFERWIELYRKNMHPVSKKDRFLRWEDYGKFLVSKILE